MRGECQCITPTRQHSNKFVGELSAAEVDCCAGGDPLTSGRTQNACASVCGNLCARAYCTRMLQQHWCTSEGCVSSGMAVCIDLVPALDATDMVLVPTFDLTDPDEEMATETTACPAMIVGEDGHALVTGDAVGSSSSATRRRRVRAPRRRAPGPPPPRLFDEDGHVTSTFERVQSDTRWGRCFSCRRALRPTVSRAGNAALMCPKKDPPNWHTRLELTPQQADLLDFPRVVYSQVRILW